MAPIDETLFDEYRKEFDEEVVSTEVQARQVLDFIREHHGCPDSPEDDQLNSSSGGETRSIHRLRKQVRRFVAKSTKIVAEQLYNERFRFFYELIQNADDAGTTSATGKNVQPRVMFKIQQERILVDLTDNRFDIRDVFAICSVGESSKFTGDTIGHKGFGFKSVFAIASIVHIQSGPWSFEFKHEKGENGIGMVTPAWQRLREELPESVSTRITLTFSEDAKATGVVPELCTQIDALSVSTIGFLKNIRKIEISLDGMVGRHKHIVFQSRGVNAQGLRELVAIKDGKKEMQFYREIRKRVTGLPTEIDHEDADADVVLRFPVSDDGTYKPCIDPRGQYVFAYLPLSRISQLPFIIHADFTLTGSRQDILDNPRNQTLKREVAKLFADAVEIFVGKEPTALHFEWLSFLPPDLQSITGFWSDLLELIRGELLNRCVFFNSDGHLRKSDQLRRLPSVFLHDNDPILPLFVDSYSYLSQDYQNADPGTLQDLGIRVLPMEEMLEIIHHDCMSTKPVFQEIPLSEPWHDSYASLLCELMRNGGVEEQNSVVALFRRYDIVPVRQQEAADWRPWKKSIYFPVLVRQPPSCQSPATVRIDMPTDLGLSVLDPQAVTTVARRTMYEMLGVTDCAHKRIRNAILEVQRSTEQPGSLENMVAHFEMLFWYGYGTVSNNGLRAASRNPGLVGPSNRLCFYPSESCEMMELVKSDPTHVYDQYFLNAKYTKSQLRSSICNEKTWKQWLEEVAGVRSHPTLDDPDDCKSLHPLIKAIRDKHPDLFLPMIRRYWTRSYSAACSSSSSMRKVILKSLVPCTDGPLTHLKDTWFPSAEIIAEARNFGVEAELHILLLPSHASLDHEQTSWPALTDLGIPAVTDLRFYERVLDIMSSQSIVETDKICEVYTQIGNLAPLNQRDSFKEWFEVQALIWDPEHGQWQQSSQCVLTSPISLQSTFVITSIYSMQQVQNLFELLLGLEDATIPYFILELEEMAKKDPDVVSLEHASDIYRVLSDMAANDEERRIIRDAFRSKKLIYHEVGWKSPEDCIWHAVASIGRYTSIEETYPGLEDFFVDILGVEPVTASLMMQELAEAAADPDESIRELMLDTGKAVLDERRTQDHSESIAALKKAKFLPCRSPSGELTFLPLNDSFFVADDERYRKLFKGKLSIVAFSYQELTTLHKLFRLLGLQKRYLSQHVSRETKEGQKNLSRQLTLQLQSCAYALSCCAVFHRSPLYSHSNKSTHEQLMLMSVYTSRDMSTQYVVKDGERQIRASAEEASLIISEIEQDHISIVLPEDVAERRLCLRGQLSGALAKRLHISNTKAERQIHRIINELDLGTDQILEEEHIPHTDSWLSKNERPSSPPEDTSTTDEYVDDEHADGILVVDESDETDVNISSSHPTGGRQQSQNLHTAIPAQVNHLTDAADYARLLEHLRRTAADVEWRERRQNSELVTANDHTSFLRGIVNNNAGSTEPTRYPELFGNDGWVKHRVGAAGELFVFELLRSLTQRGIEREQWGSRIRHFVRAHRNYSDIDRWDRAEIADISYDDEVARNGEKDILKTRLQRGVVGDYFEEWLPQWLSGECTCSETADGSSGTGDDDENDEDDSNNSNSGDDDESGGDAIDEVVSSSSDGENNSPDSDSSSDLSYTPSMSSSVRDASQTLCQGCMEVEDEPCQWLFEVKTTLGPCDTPFFISRSQYNLMQTSGTFDGNGRRTVYCIVRVYDLLQAQTGIRIFIDPWRLRDSRLRFSPVDKFSVRTT